jgi:hypothetical protein
MQVYDPVKIPEIPGKINIKPQKGIAYVRYLAERTYDPEKGYNVPKWVNIGRQIEAMPSLMYPNDNYEQIFCKAGESMDEELTTEEEQYIQNNGTYGLYSSFFMGVLNEFRQQTRKKADAPINQYKAESINKILLPLKEMMKDEEYAEMLGLINAGKDGEEGMTCSDVMILLTQYKTALAKYRRNRMSL